MLTHFINNPNFSEGLTIFTVSLISSFEIIITFPIKGNPVFIYGTKSLLRNTPILCNRVFDNYVSAEKLFAKALRSFETCVLVNKSLCRKLFSSLEFPTAFEIFKVTSIRFFIPYFNLSSCKLDNFIIKTL